DRLPFVGKCGFGQHRLWTEEQIRERTVEEQKLEPIERLVGDVQREWRAQFENPAPLYRQLAEVSELPALEKQLAENIQALQSIDRDKFDEIEQRRGALANELGAWEREQRTLLTNQRRKDVQ